MAQDYLWSPDLIHSLCFDDDSPSLLEGCQQQEEQVQGWSPQEQQQAQAEEEEDPAAAYYYFDRAAMPSPSPSQPASPRIEAAAADSGVSPQKGAGPTPTAQASYPRAAPRAIQGTSGAPSEHTPARRRRRATRLEQAVRANAFILGWAHQPCQICKRSRTRVTSNKVRDVSSSHTYSARW